MDEAKGSWKPPPRGTVRSGGMLVPEGEEVRPPGRPHAHVMHLLLVPTRRRAHLPATAGPSPKGQGCPTGCSPHVGQG